MANNQDDKKLYAFLATFFTLIGFIIALILKRDDKYVMFYAKQGLVLFLGQVIIWIVSGIFNWLTTIIWIFWIFLWILTWLNALSGGKRNTWLIGDLAKLIKL